MLEQPVPEGHPVEKMHSEAVCELSPWEGLTLEQFKEDCLPWVGPHTGAGEECEELSPEPEGVTETTCDELNAAPIPCPPAPLGRRRQGKLGVKLSLGRREEWGECVLRFSFHFSLPFSDFIGNKLN